MKNLNKFYQYSFNYFKKIFKIFFSFLLNFLIIIFFYKFKYIKSDKNKLKVCLCVIGKNENLYVKEYVEYYKKLGYNNIYIYDNNEINGERFENVIQNEINNGFISIINYRGFKAKQFQSYRDCYKNNNNKYDWLSFFDFDEFLVIKPFNIKIQKFLGNNKFKKCENIKINWIYYDNYNLYDENKPLAERIKSKIIKNRCIKSTVRGNLSINYWSKMENPHTSLNNFISCSSSGKIIDYRSPFNIPPETKYAYLKYYHIKSFEELCIKMKRGDADSLNQNLNRKLKHFYNLNKKDKNKKKIMKKIFNISFNI